MDTHETSTSVLQFSRETGILIVRAKADSELTADLARLDFTIARKMVGNLRVPVLSDVRLLERHSPEVRSFYSSPEMQESMSAMAILVDSLATRLLGNFFIYISRPPYPTQLFTQEAAALTWLSQFVAYPLPVEAEAGTE